MADEKETRIEVSAGIIADPKGDSAPDPFAIRGDELKKITYKNAALRRKNSRQMQKAYTGSANTGTKQVEIDYYSGYDAFDVIAPDTDLGYLAKIYELSSPHYAACQAKTANIVGLGYTLAISPQTQDKLDAADSDEARGKMHKKIERSRQQLERFIDNLNAEDTFVEVLYKVWIDYEATGNGYIEVGRTKNGKIGYVGHIPSTTMRVRRQRDGYVQLVSNRAIYFRNFGDLKTKDPLNNDSNPNEIIHIKKYTPTSSFYGIPDILAAKTALAGDEFAARFNLDYFEHKAVPRYIIVVKGGSLSETSEKKLHEFFTNNLKGKHHRSLYIPLPMDSPDAKVEFKMEPVEAGIQDASFDKYRKANRDEILMAHRVPISKVGMADGVSLANARDADKTFKEQVTRPEQDRLEKRVQRIIAEFTNMFIFELNEMTLTDEDTESQILERYIRNQIIVPNEARHKIGMPPRKGGDDIVELKPQEAADARANTGKTRARDAERSAGSSDKTGEGRNAKGEGRNTA